MLEPARLYRVQGRHEQQGGILAEWTRGGCFCPIVKSVQRYAGAGFPTELPVLNPLTPSSSAAAGKSSTLDGKFLGRPLDLTYKVDVTCVQGQKA